MQQHIYAVLGHLKVFL
uniref:Acyl-CoA thioesterase family protein n=1 Tax=Arundo donax TaxID=35708 RepID=A0A0A9EFT3_ARUDO